MIDKDLFGELGNKRVVSVFSGSVFVVCCVRGCDRMALLGSDYCAYHYNGKIMKRVSF